MSETIDQHIVIGRFGRPYGIHGWLVACIESDEKAAIIKYQPWLISTKTGWQNIPIDDVRIHGKKIIVHLQNIDIPEDARTYTGKEIAILRNQLPKLNKGEYYWSDLEGLTIINQDNQKLGTVSYLLRTGSNDVIVTSGDKRRLIPFIFKEVIVNIDLSNQTITVNWDSEF